jgi:integrase
LAVYRKVSASTQHQAFTARLFFYQYVLNKEFGQVEGVVSSKRQPYGPVLWSREEMETILQHVPPPYALVGKLWYGCGLRPSECLPRRVIGLNVDVGVFTIHDGKGGKDRTVPLPDTIRPELRAPLDSWQDLHQRDLERDDAGVLLVSAWEKKYTPAAQAFIWQ